MNYLITGATSGLGNAIFKKLSLNVDDNEGYTGYIDFITLDKMIEPIMRGIDKYNRRFIVIKMNNQVIAISFFAI